MDWHIVHLTFDSATHIGHDESGIGVEGSQLVIHSDTIFSALCSVWAGCKWGQGVLKSIDIDKGESPVLLSSAYPFTKETKGITYFLPRPLFPPTSRFGFFSSRVKQTEFLPIEHFQLWADGLVTNATQAQDRGIGTRDYKSLYTFDVRPRQASDRQTDATSIYYCGGTYFRWDSGLYFIAETEDKKLLTDSMKLLEHSGLGGERGVGYGAFKFEIIDATAFTKLRQIKGNLWYLLSLYYPNDKEKENLSNDALAYRLVPRKGWFNSVTDMSQGKRKTCNMFAEGSVFRSQPNGRLLNLSPDGNAPTHPIHRNGLALSLPLTSREK